MARDPATPEAPTPKGVQSATVAIAILRTLIEGGRPLYLREVAAASGMASSNVYRYLLSFVQAGMVVQEPQSGRYDLGPLAIQLGLSALRRVDAVDLAVDALEQLVQQTELDGHVTVWGSAGPTVIRCKEGSREIAVKIAEGIAFPLLTSTTGRVWAAFLPPQRYCRLLEQEIHTAARAQRANEGALRDNFDAQIRKVRESGMAMSSGERRSGIDAICAPVLNRDGGLTLTLTLVGITGSIDTRPEGKPAQHLREAVENITRRLGGGDAIVARYGWHACSPSPKPKRAR